MVILVLCPCWNWIVSPWSYFFVFNKLHLFMKPVLFVLHPSTGELYIIYKFDYHAVKHYDLSDIFCISVLIGNCESN